jgi:hypothetical protein
MGDAEFLIIVAAALLAAYCCFRVCTRVDRRQKIGYALIAWLAFGVVLGVGGWISTIRISRSARPTVDGALLDLKQTGGRSKSSYFVLATDQGQSIHMEARYSGPKLQNGQRVHVTFLEEYGAILDLEVLSGSETGWQLHEGDDLGSARLSTWAGACAATFGVVQWFVRRRHVNDELV